MSESPENRLGQQVGSYRLISWLGKGGFADVYLGEHIYLKTQSAIKMLRVQLSEETLKDFLTEARTIAKLEHPHIVRVFDYGIEDENPFLVMSYAPNGSLQQRFPKGTYVPMEKIVPIVQQIASALDYAHQQRLIHRDVKPENMLLGSQDQVLLSDFGVVVVDQSSNPQTAKNMAGTAPYMAPEQLQGKACFASDQYALGVVTYQWLGGQRPFTGSFTEIISQHILVQPPSLCEQVPSLSAAVEHVVFKALAKDSTQRYENVMAFANALQDACKDSTSAITNRLLSVPTRQLSHSPSTVAEGHSSPAGLLLTVNTPDQALNSMIERISDASDQPTAAVSVAAPSPSSPSSLKTLAQVSPLSLQTPEQPLSKPMQSSQRPRGIWQNSLAFVAIAVVIAGSLGLWYSITHSSHQRNSRHQIISATVKGRLQPSATATTNTASAAPASQTTTDTALVTPTTAPLLSPSAVPLSEPDCLTGSPSSLAFSSSSLVGLAPSSPSAQWVTLTNCGGSTTTWSYSVQTDDGGSWLIMTADSQTIPPKASEQVQVGIQPSLSSSSGTHHGSITFTKGSASWTLLVSWAVS